MPHTHAGTHATAARNLSLAAAVAAWAAVAAAGVAETAQRLPQAAAGPLQLLRKARLVGFSSATHLSATLGKLAHRLGTMLVACTVSAYVVHWWPGCQTLPVLGVSGEEGLVWVPQQ